MLSASDFDAGWEPDRLGVPMFWSGSDAATNLELPAGAGLHLEEAEAVDQKEDDGPVTFLRVLAVRPGGDGAGADRLRPGRGGETAGR